MHVAITDIALGGKTSKAVTWIHADMGPDRSAKLSIAFKLKAGDKLELMLNLQGVDGNGKSRFLVFRQKLLQLCRALRSSIMDFHTFAPLETLACV